MKRRWNIKSVALILALLMSVLGLAEELGDVTLYDLAVQAGEMPAEPETVSKSVSNEAAPEEAAPVANEVVAEDVAPDPEVSEEEGVLEVVELASEEPAGALDEGTPPEDPAPSEPGESEVSAPEAGEETETPSGQIALAASSLTLGKGEIRSLGASASGGSALSFSSSKPSVVAVNAVGEVYGKKTGSAVITVRSDGGASAKCKVKVVKAPSKVQLSASKLVLCEKETGALKTKLPSGSASLITWASSDPGVVAVDASGNLTGVAPGTAIVRATTFNGKKADCAVRVLAGSAPTSLSAGVESLALGVKEKFQLTPVLGPGENAAFTYASSNDKIAAVSASGVVTGKKAGSCKIAVTTHNGLRAVIPVKVAKSPARVTLSRTSLSMLVGETAALSAWVPAGASSGFTWSSSDESVATVDASGTITALKAGKVKIGVRTYNNKTASCAVTVTENGASVDDDPGEDTSVDDGTVVDAHTTISIKKMVANLRASTALGTKRDAIANVAELLMKNGFEAAFAAGVGANIYAEGTYGLFESSRYVTSPMARPRYFCYLDGGNYYARSNGKSTLVAVYMSKAEMKTYTGKAEARLRFDEKNYYLNNWSKKYMQDVNLSELEAFIQRLDEGDWEGKFGLGIVQWTGPRTKTLVAMYRKYAGESDTMTAEQVAAAENEMILYDFTGDYKGVYNSWRHSNKSDINSEEAARSAGSIVCTRYEIPVDKDSKAVTRGKKAKEIYRIMIGEK